VTEPNPVHVAAAKLKARILEQQGREVPGWVTDIAEGRPTARERADEFTLNSDTGSLSMRHIPCGTIAVFGPNVTAANVLDAIETHLDPARNGELFACPRPDPQ